MVAARRTLRAYPLTSAAAVAGVVATEVAWLRTGVFRSRTYWISMAICFGFMVGVDGWMSKLSAPIVIYDESHTSGVRFPWDIPTEEFLYAFALLTVPVLVWERDAQRSARPSAASLPFWWRNRCPSGTGSATGSRGARAR